MTPSTLNPLRYGSTVYYLLVRTGEQGNLLYRDYIGNRFPYSLLTSSKTKVRQDSEYPLYGASC